MEKLARGGCMRVIGGSKRGLKLVCPAGVRVRPTADRVREAVFNILAPRIVGSSVLDLMAGTGALGIEALSRGANKAVFVDNHPRSIAIIQRNLAACGLVCPDGVIKQDAIAFLKGYTKHYSDPFDLIFVDPPYKWGLVADLLRCIDKSILCPRGLVIVEQRLGSDLPFFVGQLVQTDHRCYGDSELVFYRLKC